MGLDVHAYSRLTLTDPHPFTDECWDDHHVIPRTEDFPERSAGLERGRCYVETPATAETHAFGMSYGGYNRWRAHLSQAVLGVPPETVWENFDDDHGGYSDRPLAELIHFTDCDGRIGPEVAARLHEQMVANRQAFVDYTSEADPDGYGLIRDRYLEVYDRLTRAFELGADSGLVEFR
jgi:hypothetical protein